MEQLLANDRRAPISRTDQSTLVPVGAIRPTQATVGLREVARKRAAWRKHALRRGQRFLARHVIPTVLGPRHRYYAIDRHHLARALHDEGVTHLPVGVVADLSALSPAAFWRALEERSWRHPYDADGALLAFEAMPQTLAELADDPYRSLAGALRRAGGYAKSVLPFSEFVWADFLREHIEPWAVAHDFEGALGNALRLAARTPPIVAFQDAERFDLRPRGFREAIWQRACR